MRVTFSVPSVDRVVKELGLDKEGNAQKFHTSNVLRRMMKYLPMRSGVLSKSTVITSGTSITTDTPYARYLYYGKKMVNSKTGNGPPVIPGVGPRWRKGTTLKPTDIPLDYTKDFHPLAGPFWDQRLADQEGDILAEELSAYIRSMKGGGG